MCVCVCACIHVYIALEPEQLKWDALSRAKFLIYRGLWRTLWRSFQLRSRVSRGFEQSFSRFYALNRCRIVRLEHSYSTPAMLLCTCCCPCGSLLGARLGTWRFLFLLLCQLLEPAVVTPAAVPGSKFLRACSVPWGELF